MQHDMVMDLQHGDMKTQHGHRHTLFPCPVLHALPSTPVWRSLLFIYADGPETLVSAGVNTARWVHFPLILFNSNPDDSKKVPSHVARSHIQMTPQATNRRKKGLTSCRGHSRKLHAFTWKELETVSVDQKLFGALTIGGGQRSPHVGRNTQKWCQKGAVSRTYWLKNHRKFVFYSKVLIKIYSQDFFYFKKLNISSFVFVITAFAEVLFYNIAP